MFKIIKKIFNNNKQISSNKTHFNIVYDEDNSTISVNLDIPVGEPLKEDFLYRAEKIGTFIFNICGDNTYLINPTLNALEKLKKKSTTNLLFVNNIFYVWDKLIEQIMSTDIKPVMRPSQVFKNSNNEIF